MMTICMTSRCSIFHAHNGEYYTTPWWVEVAVQTNMYCPSNDSFALDILQYPGLLSTRAYLWCGEQLILAKYRPIWWTATGYLEWRCQSTRLADTPWKLGLCYFWFVTMISFVINFESRNSHNRLPAKILITSTGYISTTFCTKDFVLPVKSTDHSLRWILAKPIWSLAVLKLLTNMWKPRCKKHRKLPKQEE